MKKENKIRETDVNIQAIEQTFLDGGYAIIEDEWLESLKGLEREQIENKIEEYIGLDIDSGEFIEHLHCIYILLYNYY